jgi:hypothetical protein
LSDRGKRAKAISHLKPVYNCFTEGFNPADLVAAARLLAASNEVG